MLVTSVGIILFLIEEWIKFIKNQSPTVHERLGVAYVSDRSRHEVPSKPGDMKIRNQSEIIENTKNFVQYFPA